MYSAMDVAKTKPLEAVPRKEKKSPRQILGEAFNRYVMEGGMTHGAALTYHAAFSLGPLLLVATAIAGWFFGENEARGELHVKLTEMFGAETATTIEGLLASVRARTSSGWAATIGIVVLLYTSSSVMRHADPMNFIWRVPHKRRRHGGWAEHYLVSWPACWWRGCC